LGVKAYAGCLHLHAKLCSLGQKVLPFLAGHSYYQDFGRAMIALQSLPASGTSSVRASSSGKHVE